MFRQALKAFLAAFYFHGLAWYGLLAAVGLGLAFGALWLAAYRPSLRPWRVILAVAAAGALLTWAAVAFVQTPAAAWLNRALLHFWTSIALNRWLLLSGIPHMLLTGLVQEGAKLLPVAVYWFIKGRGLDTRTGLLLGAWAGAGFGVFEAVWVHNTIFASGQLTWQLIQVYGIVALLGFIERFFTVAFHIATAAIAGYGLATGRGWQFYLIAAGLHGASNYGIVLAQRGLMTSIQLEYYVAGFALAVTAGALWLRYRRTTGQSAQLEV